MTVQTEKQKYQKKKFLYLPSEVFIEQRLVGLSKCLEQAFQKNHNRVKYPSLPKAKQFTIYKNLNSGLNSAVKQIQIAARAGLETG